MVRAGDPLELRFKMTVGTAQAGGTHLKQLVPLRASCDLASAGGVRRPINRIPLPLDRASALQSTGPKSKLRAQTDDETTR